MAAEAFILAIDVGRSMYGRKLQQVLEGVEMLIMQKISSEYKEDTITIVTFGTDDTHNAIADEFAANGIVDQYQHVKVLQPERQKPGVRHLHALAALRKHQQQTQHGNFQDALVVCYGIARAIRQPPNKKPNKHHIRIMMITDAVGETLAPPVPDAGGAAAEGCGQTDGSQAAGGAASQHMELDSDSDSDSSSGSDGGNSDDRIDPHTMVMDALVRTMRRDKIALDVIGVDFGGADACVGAGAAERGAPAAGMASSSSSASSSSCSPFSASSSSSCAAAAVHPQSMRLDPAMLDSKRRNEAAIATFARLVGGHVLPASRAIEVVSRVQGRTKKVARTFAGDLDIAGDIKIKVMAFAFTQGQTRPSVKCVLPCAGYDWDGNRTAANEDEDEDDMNHDATEGGDEDLNEDRSGRAIDTAAWVHLVEVKRKCKKVTADTHEPVDRKDKISAFQFGTDVVQMQECQCEEMTIKGFKSLRVIRFIPRANVPRHHFMGTVDAIVPDPESTASCRALSSLSRALHEQDAVALVRFIKVKGATPRLGCLTPHLCPASAAASAESTGRAETRTAFADDPPYDCLFFNQLPCEEDFRDYRFHPFDTQPDAFPTTEQEEAALALVDSMDLMNVPVGEVGQEGEQRAARSGAGGATEEALLPELQLNPVNNRVNKTVLDRLMNPHAPLRELHSSVREQLEMPRAIVRRQQAALQQFVRVFPLERRDAGTGLGASRAAAATAASVGAGAAAGGAAGLLGKKRRAEMAGLAAAAGADGGAGKGTAGEPAAAGAGPSAEKRARVDAAGDAVFELVGLGGAVSEQQQAVLAGARIKGRGASADHPLVDRVGPVDPIGDMRKMVARKDKDHLGAALCGMVGVVAYLARDPAQHARAVQCLRAMREVCLADGSEEVFNELLRKIRGVAQAKADGVLPACQVQMGRVKCDELQQAAPLPPATAAQRGAEAGLHDALRQVKLTLIREEESRLVVVSSVTRAQQQEYLQPVVRSAGAASGGTSLEAGAGKGESEDEFDDNDDMD